MNIGEKIKQERERRGMTQKELSEAIGVNQTQVCRIEKHGNQATLKTLKKYMNYFGWKFVIAS